MAMMIEGATGQGSSEGMLAGSAVSTGSASGSMAGSAMTGSQLNAGSALRTLIGQKEKELHDMNEYRIQVRRGLNALTLMRPAASRSEHRMAGSEKSTCECRRKHAFSSKKGIKHDKILHLRTQALEGAIAERDRQILELRENFKKLKVDFQYNLQLIEDRDSELERYDGAFANLKNVLRDRDAEVSDLKVSIDELEAQVRSEQQRAAQVEGYCKDKLAEAKQRLEGLRLQKDEEVGHK